MILVKYHTEKMHEKLKKYINKINEKFNKFTVQIIYHQ